MLCLPQQRPSPPIAPPWSRPGLAGKRSSPPPGSVAWWHGTERHGTAPDWFRAAAAGLTAAACLVRCGLQLRDVRERSKCATRRSFTVLTACILGDPLLPWRSALLLPTFSQLTSYPHLLPGAAAKAVEHEAWHLVEELMRLI